MIGGWSRDISIARYSDKIIDTDIRYDPTSIGDTITYEGDTRIHTWMGGTQGSITFPFPKKNVYILVIAGGGKGGSVISTCGGGGGGGQVKEYTNYYIIKGTYDVSAGLGSIGNNTASKSFFGNFISLPGKDASNEWGGDSGNGYLGSHTGSFAGSGGGGGNNGNGLNPIGSQGGGGGYGTKAIPTWDSSHGYGGGGAGGGYTYRGDGFDGGGNGGYGVDYSHAGEDGTGGGGGGGSTRWRGSDYGKRGGHGIIIVKYKYR